MHITYKHISSIQSRIVLLTELCNLSVESTNMKNGPDLNHTYIIPHCLPGDKKKHF